MKRHILLFLLSIYSLQSYPVLDKSAKNYLDQFFSRYKRPFTLLEACSDTKLYSTRAAKNKDFDVTAVVLVMDNSPDIAKRMKRKKLDGVVVLRPPEVTSSMLRTFGKCEQVDMVLVHDVPDYFKDEYDDFVRYFMNMGDYVAVDVSPEEKSLFETYHRGGSHIVATIAHANGDGGYFVVLKTEKRGLSAPRWSLALDARESHIAYKVTSSFAQKKIYNKALDKTTSFDKGINLLTYIMLYGDYPANEVIQNKVGAFVRLDHNDLVIGNILIQGTRLKPIDFDDWRRHISARRCVNALTSAFKYRSEVGRNPQEFLNYYKKYL
jgi:hypothetical protein